VAIDTLISFVQTYDSVEDWEADHGRRRDPRRGRRPRGGGTERDADGTAESTS
jgi:hypothetical protein